jgi:hypothetical protein
LESVIVVPTDPNTVFDWGEFAIRPLRISDEEKGSLHDAFHESDSPDHLRQILHESFRQLGPDIVETLVEDKARQMRTPNVLTSEQKPVPPKGPLTAAIAVLHELASIPKHVLDRAERNPELTRGFINSAVNWREK